MQIPAPSVIASWPTPNYVNPEHTRGPAMLILTLIFAPVSLLIVILRIYTRVCISRNFGPDDICIVIAAFCTLVCAILCVTAVQHLGWDRHIWDVPPGQLVTGLKYLMALEIAFAAGCTLTKMSLLFFFRSLMSPWSGIMRILTWVLMTICAVELVVFTIVVVFTCRPVSAYWTLSFLPQKCINEPAHLLAGGIINTVTDFCVVILPIPMVLKLKLHRRQQMILVALFGAGFVTVFAALARMFYTYQLNNADDKTWAVYPLWISGVIELYLGIIAASIPATKKLVSRYLPKLLGSSFSQSELSHREVKRSANRPRDPFMAEDVEMWQPAEEESKARQPVVVLSSFSTWTQLSRESTPSPTSYWKKSNPFASPSRTEPEITPATNLTVPLANDSTTSRTVNPAMPPILPEKRIEKWTSETAGPILQKSASVHSKKSEFSNGSTISSFNVASPTELKSHLSWERGRPFFGRRKPRSVESKSEPRRSLDVNLVDRPSGEDDGQRESQARLGRRGSD